MASLLADGQVLVHPFVIAEIALASVKDREAVLGALRDLPNALVATPQETLFLIEREGLYNRGIGYVDTSLLASARLQPGTTVWTRDKRLARAADELGLSPNLLH
ncbi:type II toxin-antitoxin system VapC family toxin [Bordetella bronchialis]|uniref:type II toxin-antitoxin system VapC family toxin n=1 Tax=Bordetella bronchialis TaxID=463025 RepID=UPI001E3AA88E|nr:type II toxin-antitoxin system VapC family toxin [Bordetella bronchialis]